jgi:selenocysteine lyase/cysteine desulfurase
MKRKEFLRNIAGTALGAGLVGTSISSCSKELEKSTSNAGFEPMIRGDFQLASDLTFLNNGTLGLSPMEVTQVVKDTTDYVNATGNYRCDYKAIKESLGRLLKVDQDRLTFTHNVTEGVNIVSAGLHLKPGDEVILSDQEHVGNAVPWLYHTRKFGAKITPVTLGANGDETLANIRKVVNSKTRVIAIPHIPCTTGQVNPIKEIALFAKSRGIITCVDGAHGPGMLDMDLSDMGCDIYISCGHKWMLGPKGVGFVYLSPSVDDVLQTEFVGERSFTAWETHHGSGDLGDPKNNPSRFFYGTQNTALFKGLQQSAEFHLRKDPKETERYVKRLAGKVLDGLNSIKQDLEILTPQSESDRGGMVSFRFKNKDTRAIYDDLRRAKFVVRYVAESDLHAIRVSTHLYNNEEDVNSFLKKLDQLALG